MNENNKKVDNVVLFTIRGIESSILFKDIIPTFSESIFKFLFNLNDELPNFLKGKMDSKIAPKSESCLLSEFCNKWAENKKVFENYYIWAKNPKDFKEYNNRFSKEQESNIFRLNCNYSEKKTCIANLQNLKADFMDHRPSNDDMEVHNKMKVLFELIKLPNQNEGISTQDIPQEEIKKIWEDPLSCKITHCDRPEGGTMVKHRLGIYSKANGSFAACAVYPWSGAICNNHDKLWKEALINSVFELYPNAKKLLLICHDKDFSIYDNEDKVVSKNLNENGSLKTTDDNEKPQISFVIFQHTNLDITSSLNNDKVKEVFDKMNNLISGYSTLQEMDKKSENAEAHKRAYHPQAGVAESC